MPWRQNGTAATFNLAPGSGAFRNSSLQFQQQAQAGAALRVPSFQRQVSYGAPPSSVPDEGAFDEDDSLMEDGAHRLANGPASHLSEERRTLYLNGFSDSTTYKDLLSVIRGGKLLSVNLRSERSATVTFLDGAEAFLVWAKRHDIYLHSKRVSVVTHSSPIQHHICALTF